MMTAVAAVLLPPGETAGITVRALLRLPVEAVAGYNGTSVIRIAADAVNLTECRVYSPTREECSIMWRPQSSRTRPPRRPPHTSSTSRRRPLRLLDHRRAPTLVFTDTYHSGIRSFSPGGDWRVVVYDQLLKKNRSTGRPVADLRPRF